MHAKKGQRKITITKVSRWVKKPPPPKKKVCKLFLPVCNSSNVLIILSKYKILVGTSNSGALAITALVLINLKTKTWKINSDSSIFMPKEKNRIYRTVKQLLQTRNSLIYNPNI